MKKNITKRIKEYFNHDRFVYCEANLWISNRLTIFLYNSTVGRYKAKKLAEKTRKALDGEYKVVRLEYPMSSALAGTQFDLIIHLDNGIRITSRMYFVGKTSVKIVLDRMQEIREQVEEKTFLMRF